MLGPFLGVGQQPFGESGVFLRRRSPRPCAGQRPDGDRVVNHSYHDLWGTADEGALGRAEIEHEGAGIDHPKRAVEFQRREVEGHRQSSAQHHLEDVAGADVFDGFVDRRQKLFPRKG